MKYLSGLVFLFLLSMTSSAQEKPVITGHFTEKKFKSDPPWKLESAYKFKKSYLDSLEALKGKYDVKIFYGSWCSDSEEWVPAFFSLREKLPVKKVSLIGLDRTKKDPEGDAAKYSIEMVPTFIFLKGGKEIGRITETPDGLLEKVILDILSK